MAAGELALVRSIRSRTTRSTSVRLGIGDDCAVLRPPAGHDVLVTTDFSLENRHFRRDWHPASSVGHRCLARGLSDLAAMGATPMAAFLSLALPAGMTIRAAGRRWVDGFLTGLLDLARVTGTTLAGGDTAAAPGEQILADITLVGSAPRGKELRRSGARAGDAIYVTGSLGGSAAELAALGRSPRKFRTATASADHPHLYPAPRLNAGKKLQGVATAAIDLSDGLSTDLHHLCAESGVGAVIESVSLPLHKMLTGLAPEAALDAALNGGEDYELLFTARAGTRLPRRIGGTPVTRIGSITKGEEVMLVTSTGTTPLQARGWEHLV